VNETNQGQFAALLIFISVLLVLGSLLTAFAETGFPDTDLGGGGDTPQVTDYDFSSPTPILSTTPTMILNTPASPVPSTTIISGIDAGVPNEATSTPAP